VIGAALVVAACTTGRPTVERWVDGRLVAGRFVDSTAYAAYGGAVLLEARGDDRGALELYRKALESDPDSVEILTRMAAVLCRVGSTNEAADTFDQARLVDPTYAPGLREEARCRLRQGQVRPALELGLRAVALDPRDEEASIVVAQAYAADGDRAAARRWLEGLALFRPELERARAALVGRERESGSLCREVDRLLVEGRLGEARRGARRAGMEPAELALRAVALGRAELGGQQAGLVIAADPTSADAWVAGLVAADLTRDEATFASMLGALDREAITPGPLGSWLLAELLARRVDPQAARAWLGARGQLGPSRGEPARDALEQAVMTRVEALMAGQ
jgi:hypothetical protein